MIVELSVLNSNLTEESPGEEIIDPTTKISLDQKKSLPEDGEKEKKKTENVDRIRNGHTN